MPTLSDIPDDELLRIYKQGGSAPDLSSMSNEDLMRAYQQSAPAKQEEPGITIPGIGRPSLIGMVKGILEAGKSAATLPGDVYAGKVDPLSDEGIKRATDFASFVTPGGRQTVMNRAATAEPLAAPQISKAATDAYTDITYRARQQSISPAFADRLSQDVANVVGTGTGPRRAAAPGTYGVLDDIAGAKDLGDLIDQRRRLTAIRREGGTEGHAAAAAINRLDMTLEGRAKDKVGSLVPALRDADKNYAIASRAEDVQTRLRDATNRETGIPANNIRNAFRPLMEKGRDEFMSPGVAEAMSRTTTPGLSALKALSVFDPIRHPWLAMASAGPTAGINLGLAPIGLGATAMRNRIMRKRAEDVSRAIREEAPANGPGYSARYRVGMEAPPVSPMLSLPLLSGLNEQ